MFKNTGSGKNGRPSGGFGSHGKPKQPPQSKPSVTTGEYATEGKLAGSIFMKPALDVGCPKSQAHGRVTNRDGKRP